MPIDIPLTKDQLKVGVFWLANIILFTIFVIFFPYGIVALVPLFLINFIVILLHNDDTFGYKLKTTDFYPFLKWFRLREE